MSGFVLDASVARAWCFADEATEGTRAALERARAEKVMVPAQWPLELANILAGGERQGLLTSDDVGAFLALLAPLDIRVDAAGANRGLTDILSLARRATLTSFAAATLDLALRERLPLATRDEALAGAAEFFGVEVMRC